MRRLGESLRVRYLQALGDTVEMPADGYQGEYLEAHGADLAREHGPSLRDEPWERFKDLAEARIAEGQRRTLGALGVRMDCFFNEQSLYETGAVQTVLERLRAAGYTYEQDGATWFRATALDGAEDRVVVRSTGEATYRLPDIAYHVDKLTRGYDLIVDVLGADHKDAFPDVVRGLRALGLDATPVRLLMNQFVTFRGGRMSKRAGHFATLDELLSEVGRDVARFFLLMRSAEAHLEFDLDLARDQSDTNPVYYVQYAHARICSILRMAEERGFSGEGGDVSLLVHTSETRLIRRLLDLSETIHLVVTHLAPHHLTTYARDLATDFHAFYRDCRVLDEGDRRLSSSRLRLVEAARISLARALDLLGVSAPTEM
jgi:arginyl-tRNA synthetase